MERDDDAHIYTCSVINPIAQALNRIFTYARHHRAAQADGIMVLTTDPGVPEILSMVRDVDSSMPLCGIMWIPYLS